MYRPNRIGPWNLYDSEKQEVVLNSANATWASISAEMDKFANPLIWVTDSVVREQYNSITFRVNNTTTPWANTLGARKALCFGLCVNGDQGPYNLPYIYSISGGFQMNANNDNVSAQFIVGRRSSAVMTPNALNNLATTFIPGDQHITLSPTKQIQGTINTQFLAGNFSGESTSVSTDPMCFGVRIINHDNSSAHDIGELYISLSIEKFIADTVTFDPQLN